MINKLSECSRRPEVYTPSSAKFWYNFAKFIEDFWKKSRTILISI